MKYQIMIDKHTEEADELWAAYKEAQSIADHFHAKYVNTRKIIDGLKAQRDMYK